MVDILLDARSVDKHSVDWLPLAPAQIEAG
jgi:hypothetical protein